MSVATSRFGGPAEVGMMFTAFGAVQRGSRPDGRRGFTHVSSSSESVAMPNAVTQVPAAPSPLAIAHFEAEFTFETDCWDVYDAMKSGSADFVLVDVRSHVLFGRGHVPGAISIPHAKL